MDALMKIVEWMLFSHIQSLYSEGICSLWLEELASTHPPSSPFVPMANWMHRNLNVNHYSLYIYSSASTTFNPCFAAVASRRADRCVSLS